jgi:hypothetical protein
VEPPSSPRHDEIPSGGLRDPLRRFLAQAPELHPLSLRFLDPAMEAGFQASYLRDSLPYIRLAHVVGIVT